MQTAVVMPDRRNKDLGQLMRVALGEEKADLVIKNARLLNVYTGELLDSHSVSVKGEWIACVGGELEHTIGPESEPSSL